MSSWNSCLGRNPSLVGNHWSTHLQQSDSSFINKMLIKSQRRTEKSTEFMFTGFLQRKRLHRNAFPFTISCLIWKKPFSNLCSFPPTNADEITKMVSSLKCKTIPSRCSIPAEFLNISANGLPSSLSEIFLKCMAKPEFPNRFEIA